MTIDARNLPEIHEHVIWGIRQQSGGAPITRELIQQLVHERGQLPHEFLVTGVLVVFDQHLQPVQLVAGMEHLIPAAIHYPCDFA